VHRGDGGLQLVRADVPAGQCLLGQRGTLSYLAVVPQRAVLLGERYQAAVWPRARGAACVGEQHQGEQAGYLSLVRGQAVQPAGEPDRLVGQGGHGDRVAVTGGVALAEDQVEDVQHGGQPGAVAVQRETGFPDHLLGAADPLRHRRLRHAEGRGDLRGAQPADRAQRERDLARRRQVRVAAAEQQGQRVVLVLPGQHL
jgi:hypothetical protein